MGAVPPWEPTAAPDPRTIQTLRGAPVSGRSPLPLLLALAAALAVGAAFLWRSAGPGPEGLRGAPGSAATADAGPQGAELAAVPAGRAAAAPRAGAADWQITVVDGTGAPVRDATVRAAHADGASEGLEAATDAAGAVSFAASAAGSWALTVTAPRWPAFERTVQLVAGQTTRTRVVLGAPHTLAGRVRDSYGDPRRQHIVCFVPGDTPLPTSARDWTALPHGRTDLAGNFRVELPERGDWRAFVGYSGKVLFEDQQSVTFTDAGPFEVELVVQAPTRLLIEAHEPDGARSDLPIGVTVYRKSELLDRERPLPPQVEPGPLPDLDDPSLDEDTRAELTLAVEAETRPQTAEERAALAYRLQVVPEGWRMDRSSLLSAERRLLLEFLPAHEELRFAVSRGPEVFRVLDSAFLNESPPTRVTLYLPPAPPAGQPLPTAPEGLRALVEPVTLPREPLPVGATWR